MTGTHELKTWPAFFQPLVDHKKWFELRRLDRAFQVGDVLTLREYDPETQTYTGRQVSRSISYILTGLDCEGLQSGFGILGIR